MAIQNCAKPPQHVIDELNRRFPGKSKQMRSKERLRQLNRARAGWGPSSGMPIILASLPPAPVAMTPADQAAHEWDLNLNNVRSTCSTKEIFVHSRLADAEGMVKRYGNAPGCSKHQMNRQGELERVY